MENKDYVIVCTNCSQVDDYERLKESCNFHYNNCKIVRSISLKKYYLNKVILNLTKKYDIIITTKNKNKIIADFQKRNNILPQINDNRKRMININFIMIFNDMLINIDYVKVTKSKKTL